MPTQLAETLLVVGASCRSVLSIASLAKATPSFIAVDLFSDWDTQKMADCFRVSSLSELPEKFKIQTANSWLMAGGMENHRDLVESLSKRIPLIGCHSDSFSCNCPHTLARLFAGKDFVNSRLGFPEVLQQLPENAEASDWLSKPYGSTGGTGIQLARASCSSSGYLQRRVRGKSVSAVFLACVGRRNAQPQCELLGTTAQEVGIKEFAAKPFAYCGSIGPIEFDDGLTGQIRRLGQLISEAFQLRGVFGIDVIQDGEDIWVVDINPRFPASAEIVQLFQNPYFNLFDLHCDQTVVMGSEPHGTHPEGTAGRSGSPASCFGKAILFNRLSTPIVVAPEIFEKLIELYQPIKALLGAQNFTIADVPCVNTEIQPGWPILTVLVRDANEESVRRKLMERAHQLYDLFECLHRDRRLSLRGVRFD